MNVYVASPYSNADFVREMIYPQLRELALQPVSSWATYAHGPEDFSRMTVAALREAIAQNDQDVVAADVVLLYDLEARGRETYAEVGRALALGKAVVWVGRPALSAFRLGVVRVEDLAEGLATLARMRVEYANGSRGLLLAHLAQGAA